MCLQLRRMPTRLYFSQTSWDLKTLKEDFRPYQLLIYFGNFHSMSIMLQGMVNIFEIFLDKNKFKSVNLLEGRNLMSSVLSRQ